MQGKPVVSIICITYNHESFIRRCIEGFLIQKTDFPFEILIHDDASTDGTAAIIREYQERYPELIYMVLEKENLYSKGISYMEGLYRKAKGKYIALCEGDDYWIDDRKLQIQIDYMEKHPECSMTMHNAYCFYPFEKNDGKFHPVLSTFERECDTDFEMQLCAGISATASFVLRTHLLLESPPLLETAPTGDDPMRYYMAYRGKIHYFDRIMSVRNALYGWSWNDQIKNNFEMRYTYFIGYIKFFKLFDDYTEHKYTVSIQNRRNSLLYNLYALLDSSSMGTRDCMRKIEQINEQTEREFEDRTKEWIGRLNDKKDDYLRETMDTSILDGQEVYIYGAGEYGNICSRQLKYCGIAARGHVISDHQDKDNQNVEGSLCYLSELCENKDKVFLMIGVGKKNIASVLREVGMSGMKFYWPDYH